MAPNILTLLLTSIITCANSAHAGGWLALCPYVRTDVYYLRWVESKHYVAFPVSLKRVPPVQTRESGRNVNTVSEYCLRGLHPKQAMDLADWLRTSADERVLSGWSAVMMA